MYYPSSKNKGADQLRIYCEADLFLYFGLGRLLVFPCGCSFLVHGSYSSVESVYLLLVNNILIICSNTVHISQNYYGICDF